MDLHAKESFPASADREPYFDGAKPTIERLTNEVCQQVDVGLGDPVLERIFTQMGKITLKDLMIIANPVTHPDYSEALGINKLRSDKQRNELLKSIFKLGTE